MASYNGGCDQDFLMNENLKNMPIVVYKRVRKDEEDENPSRRWHFIDDEAEKGSIVIDSGSEGEVYERDDCFDVDGMLFLSSKELRRWSFGFFCR